MSTGSAAATTRAGPAAAATGIPERNWVNVQWLVRLRWAEIAGQAVTVFVGQFLLAGRLPLFALLGVIAAGLVSNLFVELYFFGDRRRGDASPKPVHEWQLALVMTLDIALLTGLLYLTGGPNNPFAFLYLVQIALAAVLVRARWTWMLVGLSFVGFGILILAREPLAIPAQSREVGAWFALGVASAFVVHFLLRITGALAQREDELGYARHLAARQERLASLATMAAGAAHELSTPLGTVALAAKELEHALERHAAPPSGGAARSGEAGPLDQRGDFADLAADARLIREQVGRCRAILEQMAQGAGTVGEGVAACTVGELVAEAMVGIRDAPRVVREVPDEVARSPLRLPPRAVSQALRSLVTNAQDASPAHTAVILAVARDERDGMLAVTVRDRGAGMPVEVMARIGEPFFTTKPPGRGMGLGLFLARAVIEGVGGDLHIDSMAGDGTSVHVRLPIDVGAGVAIDPAARSREPIAAQVVSKPA